MAELNKLVDCLTQLGLTAVPNCFLDPKKIIGAFLVDRQWKATTANLANLETFLQGAMIDDGAARIWPVFRFGDIADNSEDVVITTLGYGTKFVAREGQYDWMFRVMKGGICLQNQLRKFNNQSVKALFVDSDNVIYGTMGSDGVSMEGIPLDFFYAYPFKAMTGAESAIFNVRFVLTDVKSINDNIAFVKAPFDVQTYVNGIMPLFIVPTDLTDGTFSVKVLAGCDKVDLFNTYKTELADPNAFKLLDSNGDPATIDTVTADATTEEFIITPHGGAGTYTIQSVSAKALEALDIGGNDGYGYETIAAASVTVTQA